MNANHTQISIVAALTIALIATTASAGLRYQSTPAGVPVPVPTRNMTFTPPSVDVFAAVGNLAGALLHTAGNTLEAIWPHPKPTAVAKPGPSSEPKPEPPKNSAGK